MLTYRDHESRLGICNQYKHISIQAMFVNPQIKIWTDINTGTIITIKNTSKKTCQNSNLSEGLNTSLLIPIG